MNVFIDAVEDLYSKLEEKYRDIQDQVHVIRRENDLSCFIDANFVALRDGNRTVLSTVINFQVDKEVMEKPHINVSKESENGSYIGTLVYLENDKKWRLINRDTSLTLEVSLSDDGLSKLMKHLQAI